MFFINTVQEAWKVSTTAGGRRGKKGLSIHEASTSGNQLTKESEALPKQNATAVPSTSLADSPLVSYLNFFYLVALNSNH